MHVSQLFDALVFGENVEVIVAGLPEWPLRTAQSDGELDCLDGPIEAGLFGFVDQQVDMLRHDDISGDDETVFLPDSFQCVFKETFGFGGGEVRETVVAAEGEKVHVTGLLVTN
jgi:hypothetical protein